MRSRLNWLVFAVTSLVVVAFVVPLGLLVRRQATERAQVNAEQSAQSAAAALVVAVASADGTVDRQVAESALISEVGIVLPDGTSVGGLEVPPDLTATVVSGQPGVSTTADGSWYVGLPVATPSGVVVVAAAANSEEMTAGVWPATALLAALALVLVAGSVLLADRLGRSLVKPVSDAADVALQLAEGNLAVRVPVTGPPEIRNVAEALNALAGRLSTIIDNERRSLADLSHRLRTPLTALRLEAERLEEPGEGGRLVDQVDRTQRAVDQLIEEVGRRGKTPDSPETSDLVAVIRQRLAFWSVLAAEQNRQVTLNLGSQPVQLATPAPDIAAVVDALVGNIFAHTPTGTDFSISISDEKGTPILSVLDQGPGFPPGDSVVRGKSGAGSTGLGLDIARSFAERLGGSLRTDEGPEGGALITVRLG